VARYVRRPIPERPDVRSVYDLAETTEQANVLRLFLGADEMGHPIAMPPETPRDRVETVRNALMLMVKDPEFWPMRKSASLIFCPAATTNWRRRSRKRSRLHPPRSKSRASITSSSWRGNELGDRDAVSVFASSLQTPSLNARREFCRDLCLRTEAEGY